MGNSLPRIDSSARDLTASRSSPSACKQRGRSGGCCMSVSCATCLSRRRATTGPGRRAASASGCSSKTRTRAGTRRRRRASAQARRVKSSGSSQAHVRRSWTGTTSARRSVPRPSTKLSSGSSGWGPHPAVPQPPRRFPRVVPELATQLTERPAPVRVDRAPVVDGRLDDPVSNLAPAVTDFRQTDPDEGAPVSEATAVRVLYDGTAVYVGARLFDSAPARIVRRLARRDASTHSDKFRVLLDSYHDRRTAFEFDDASWDPVWEAATSVDSIRVCREAVHVPGSRLSHALGQGQRDAALGVSPGVHRLSRLDAQSLELLPLRRELRRPT